MANGDIAVAEAGFTAVKNTDDFRLGYDRINEAADLAVRRGIRSFATKAAMDAVPGLFDGALAVVSGTKVTYRWNAAAAVWRPWASPVIGYATTLGGITSIGTNGVQSAYYRWENGLVKARLDIVFGSGPTFNGAWTFTAPFNYRDDFRVLGAVDFALSGQLPYTGFSRSRSANNNLIDLYSVRTDGTFATGIAYANNQPVAVAQSSVLHAEAIFESYDNAIN